VDRGADGDAPPLDDLPVQVGGRLPDLGLGPELARRLGQPLDLPPQAQRRRQHLLGRHALAPGVVPQPGLAVVAVGGAGPDVERLARPRQVVEDAAPLGVGHLLVDPGPEVHLRRLAVTHRIQANPAPCPLEDKAWANSQSAKWQLFAFTYASITPRVSNSAFFIHAASLCA